MMQRARDKDYLKPKDVAKLLRIEPATVRLWTRNGKLRSTTTAGGHRRFDYRDVEMFAREHNIALPAGASDHLRVLVVDDDKHSANMIKDVLLSVDSAIQVEIAHDGFAAGQTVEQFEPNIIILDLIMPGVDGYQLCKTIKNAPATVSIRIIAVTGDRNPAAASEIVRLGAEVCLLKPLKNSQLIEAVGLSIKQEATA